MYGWIYFPLVGLFSSLARGRDYFLGVTNNEEQIVKNIFFDQVTVSEASLPLVKTVKQRVGFSEQ